MLIHSNVFSGFSYSGWGWAACQTECTSHLIVIYTLMTFMKMVHIFVCMLIPTCAFTSDSPHKHKTTFDLCGKLISPQTLDYV